MSLELYAAYVVATLIVLALPGPTVMLVVSYALTQGRRTVLASILGVGLGDATAATVSLLGMGALLAASATLFTLIKICGAAYLAWLGLKLWRAKPHVAEMDEEASRKTQVSARRVFVHSFVVTALNPKGILFFIAFLPQFVAPSQPLGPQLGLLGVTFVVLAMANAGIYAMLAAEVGERFRSPTIMGRIQKVGGSVMIAAALLTLRMQKV
ncbi:LysE family translocator [Roseibium aestuarii]|uniref:LysE family translocator n=1 Tax=Roseibium aestuarii TaxID=2600299 RepID=A0ABW4JZ80_9HYPH|nr:LysE family translocator [Roseibium aestuarii]